MNYVYLYQYYKILLCGVSDTLRVMYNWYYQYCAAGFSAASPASVLSGGSHSSKAKEKAGRRCDGMRRA